MLEHISYFKDIARTHLVGKILKAIFPITWGSSKIFPECFKKRVAFARGYRAAQTDFDSVRDGDQNEGIGCGKSKRIERQGYGPDLLLFNLFDCADSVIGVNNFLADLEAHLYTSDSFTSTRLVAFCAADRQKKLSNESLMFGFVL